MKKWVAGLGLGVLALGGALAVRTVTFAPAGVSDGSDIKVAAAPAFDLASAASHLGAAVRFLTVSNQDPAENTAEE